MLCRTETFSKSFFSSAIILWNNLEQDIKDPQNLESFKRALGRNHDTSFHTKMLLSWEARSPHYPQPDSGVTAIHSNMICSKIM
jgi:hypothetical protein